MTLIQHTFCLSVRVMHFTNRAWIVFLRTTGKCPVCNHIYIPHQGCQPSDGRMDVEYLPQGECPLSGYPTDGTIVIKYFFPSGIQGPEHPNPGVQYSGTSRTAYLPDTTEGREVLNLLKQCFKNRLTFTVGRSITTGRDNCVVWNGVHHKTNTSGGATNFGYPDPSYFTRVKCELLAKGFGGL